MVEIILLNNKKKLSTCGHVSPLMKRPDVEKLLYLALISRKGVTHRANEVASTSVMWEMNEPPDLRICLPA